MEARLPGGFVIPGGVAIWAFFGSLVLGVALGLTSGYYGGWTDQVIMQLADALIAFPRIILYLVVIAALGQGDWVVIIAITVTGAPGVALGPQLGARHQKPRLRAGGASAVRAPSILCSAKFCPTPVAALVDAMLRVGAAIFAIATLGFLGIGLPPLDPDWGNMVNESVATFSTTPTPCSGHL
ncbi:MAG: hypothetical protein R2911_22250 [Caldilineaceae bacterium]